MKANTRKSKEELRKLGRKVRRELEDRARRSQQICSRIQTIDEYLSANAVCCYVHSKYEVQTLKLIEDRVRNRLTTFVPYCDGDHLRLFPLQDLGQLERGNFGIHEPLASLRSAHPLVDVDTIDLYLVPGVAFDLACRRIGQGAGFYDRLLSKLTGKTLIGLSFECQVFSTVTAELHDIPMSYVVTESRIIEQP